MIELVQRAATKDIVLDRSHYGEPIWSQIYGRPSLLTEDDIEILREMEDAVGVRRILMHDPNVQSHWQRCVDNKEPLTRPQFMRARTMYDRMATKYGFEKICLAETPDYKPENPSTLEQPHSPTSDAASATASIRAIHKTKEQVKLEKANAINDVLSKRIVKGKGLVFDEIENEVRSFLNKKLGTILGSENKDSLSEEEILIVRAFVKRLKEKETK